MPQGKLILITGTSRGLGQAMAASMIQQGHRIVGCSRAASDVRRVSDEFPAPHRFDEVDVSQDEQVGQWSQSVLAECGVPDLLINNAGLVNANNDLWKVPPDEFSQVIDVNIKGIYHVIRHFVPAMISRGTGTIVNFSSGWGRSTSPEVAPYCATKWAVEGLTRAFADELPEGMAAVSLNPGVIHTRMLASCFGESAQSYPEPQQWAERAVPFLLKIRPASNGEALTVPGG